MHAVDWSILGLYAVFLAFLTIKLSRNKGDDSEESYLLAGRRLTLPSFIATTVSTWYGGILGVGEYSYNYGISNWLVFGLPYYLAAFIFAMFIAKKARESQFFSIPDQLHSRYGKNAALGGAVWVFVKTVPSAYILMLGVLLNLLFGWGLLFCVIVAAMVSSIYVIIGGFRSVVKTDYLQFSLMFGAFIMIVIDLMVTKGGISFLRDNLPTTHFDPTGGRPIGYIISWYFIALSALVEPSFYQRCYAAKSPSIAKKGILYSIVFWMFFDLMTTTSGMYARAILGDDINGMYSYPLLANQILPIGLLALFVLGMLTTIQSTIDSYTFLAASTLGRDVLGKVPWFSSRMSNTTLTRWGLLLSGGLAIIIAMAAESVITIWHTLGSIGTPALLLPLALSFTKRYVISSKWVILNMLLAPVASALWFILQNNYGKEAFPLSIQPIFIGLGISIVCMYLGSSNSRYGTNPSPR